MAKKVLIIGATGLVGGYLKKAFSAPDFEALGADFIVSGEATRQLDIRDEEAVRNIITEYAPDVILVPAAIPNVELCETNPEDTRPTNITGMENIIKFAGEAKLVYFSSDYIFDGVGGFYKEDDAPNPLNEYGKQKLEIEERIKNNLRNYIVVRTTGVYGWHEGRKNYVLQVVDRVKAGADITAAIDQIYCPTYAGDIAFALKELVLREEKGVFHIVGREALNRVDFTKKIADIFDLYDVRINAAETHEMTLKAKRPLNSSLNTEKLFSLGIIMSDVYEGLQKMKKELFAENGHGQNGA